MNTSTSDCSSGCESGWTTYFDQFSYFSGQCYRADADGGGEEFHRDYYEEDEDMSMVSDASSGPPPNPLQDKDCFNDSDGFCYATFDSEKPNNKCSKQQQKRKNKTKEQRGVMMVMQQSSHLDDTASSSTLSFSKRNAARSNKKTPAEHVQAFSQGFSATCFKKRTGFLQNFVPGEAAPEK